MLEALIARHRVGVRRACVAVVLFAIGLQLRELFVEVDDVWPAVASIYASSAAIGIDAIATGVRRRVGEGPSIRNLAPGGWALFAASLWLLAVPAYFVGARRRALRGEDDPDDAEPVSVGSFVAIAATALIAVTILVLGASR
jgi:hypothetical protein